MSIALRTVALAAIAAVALAGATTVSAQEATPTPSPDATSTITIRFVHDGEPLIIATGTPTAFANAKECGLSGPAVVHEVTRRTISWPSASDVDPADCSQLGAVVKICFGNFCTEAVWQGLDTVIDLEVPDQPGKSVVTAHFVSEGQPVQVTLTGWEYEADGESCLTTTPAHLPVEDITSVSRFWPTDGSFFPACETIGSVIRAKFTTEEFGEGQGTFVWSGQDAVFDVTFGDAPGELPSTGAGFSANGSSSLDFSVAGLATFLILAGTLLIYLGRAQINQSSQGRD